MMDGRRAVAPEYRRAGAAVFRRDQAHALRVAPLGVVIPGLAVDADAGVNLIDALGQAVAVPDARACRAPLERLRPLRAAVLREVPAVRLPRGLACGDGQVKGTGARVLAVCAHDVAVAALVGGFQLPDKGRNRYSLHGIISSHSDLKCPFSYPRFTITSNASFIVMLFGSRHVTVTTHCASSF